MHRNGTDRRRKAMDARSDEADGHREQLLGALKECYDLSSSEAEYRFRQCIYGSETEPDFEVETLSRLRRSPAH